MGGRAAGARREGLRGEVGPPGLGGGGGGAGPVWLCGGVGLADDVAARFHFVPWEGAGCQRLDAGPQV